MDTSSTSPCVVFRYWSSHLNDQQAKEMSEFMAKVLDGFIDKPNQSIAEFDSEIKKGVTPNSPVFMLPGAYPLSPRDSETSLAMSSADTHIHDTTTKQTLIAIVGTLLNLPQEEISGEDSFFDLGGDSITAMKLVGEARDHDLSLTVADIFRNPILNDLAEKIASKQPKNTASAKRQDSNGAIVTATTTTAAASRRNSDNYERFSLLAASNVDAFLQTNIVPQVAVFRGGLSDVLPATDFQSLCVAGSLLESRWMVNYFSLEGDGPLNIVQLKRAFFKMVQSLDILRTVFVPSGGRFLQVVLRTLRPAVHVVDVDDDVSSFNPRSVETDITPASPLTEFTVVRHKNSNRHRILMRLSHAQYDGVCMPKILDALQAAFRGETVPSPPTFANYLRASAGSLTSEHYQHWKELLTGSKMTEIVRRDGPDYACKAQTTLKKTIRLPPVESGHVTTATVVKAAWAYVLAQVSASPDVVFGHTISGRNATVDGVNNMIGPCLNLLPVRVQFQDKMTARQLLYQIQDQQLANMAHEVLGFREIVRHCTSWPDWTFFSSTVQHQNIQDADDMPVRLGNVDYKSGFANAGVPHGDFSDLNVFSQPLAENDKCEIMLSFTEGGAITTEFVQHALDMLCEAASLFASNQDTILPSPDSLSSLPKQIPFNDSSASSPSSTEEEESYTHSALKQLQHGQLLDLSHLVTAAWNQVLQHRDSHAVIDPYTSFFNLGGDLIGLSQLVYLLDQSGSLTHPPKLEDLMAHPTVRGHMAVLASSLTASPRTSTDGVGTDASVTDDDKKKRASTFPLTMADKKERKLSRKDSSLAKKAFKLAKRLTLVNGGGKKSAARKSAGGNENVDVGVIDEDDRRLVGVVGAPAAA